MKDQKYVLHQDVVIRKGTILTTACNEHGGEEYIEVCVEMGENATANLTVNLKAIEDMPDYLIAKIYEDSGSTSTPLPYKGI